MDEERIKLPRGPSIMRTFCRWLVGLAFIAAGANHFHMPELYVAMIPPLLPWPQALNATSGLAEILGGLGLLIPATQRWAGIGLIVLLIAIFPANVYVAMRGHMDGLDVSPLGLWLRLPFQAVFVAAVWWVALKREKFESAWDTPFN